MSRYEPLFSAIATLEANHKPPELIDSPYEFPFPQMYPGQEEILSKAQNDESFCLTSHTGFGKSPVFLSLTRGQPSIVIEPRKFLQAQIAKYYTDFCLYGRSGYPCQYAHSAAGAPCLLKESCDGTTCHDTCKKATQTCLNNPCKVFPVGKEWKMYPCPECEYMIATWEARSRLQSGETIICNFGNFWNLLKAAKTVVVDEADLFFRSINAPMRLKYSKPSKSAGDDIKTLLQREVKGLKSDLKDSNASFRYAAQNLLYSCQFLLANADLCFTYQRKDRIYVEIDPRNTNILSQKLFRDKRVIIVSATPGAFDLPSHSAEIHQRCGIFFAPVGNLTSFALKRNPYLMNSAAKTIVEISDYMDMVYDASRVVIHCGNLGTHAASIFKILGEDNCTLHSAGKLAETISDYLLTDKRYLLVAAAEHGGDFGWCKLQFILKFPYPNLDERMRTLEKTMGPEFKAFYEQEARTRVIQMAGRNVRGFDDFGITVCLDSKVREDYEKNKRFYPEWFQNRVDERCY